MVNDNPDKFAEVVTGNINYKEIFTNAGTSGLQYFFLTGLNYVSVLFESIRQGCENTRALLNNFQPATHISYL